MKSNTHIIRNSHEYRRRTDKPHRRLWLVGAFLTLLLVCGYGFISSKNDTSGKDAIASLAKTTSPKTSPPKNVQLAWPAVGQAAVGTVEDGLITQSSDDETTRPTASMAKVIAALAIMEKQPLKPGQQGQTYTITNEDIENLNTYIAKDGSALPLRIGTEVTQYQAMQRMLIASDNNMADMLTERIFGSRAAYVSYAQKMLKRMGLNNTIVNDASGFSSSTVSTPSELVAIGIAALKNPVIAEIVAQQQVDLSDIGIISNTNRLLGTDGVIGIKTGTTENAGSCLLFAARYTTKDRQEKTIVGVIMGDTDHDRLYDDTTALLASARQSFGLVNAQTEDTSAIPQPGLRDRTLSSNLEP